MLRDYPVFIDDIRQASVHDAYAAIRDLEWRARSEGAFDSADRMRELADAMGADRSAQTAIAVYRCWRAVKDGAL